MLMPRASYRIVLGVFLIIVWSINIWLTGPRLDMILVLIIVVVSTILTVLEWRQHPGIQMRQKGETSPYLIVFVGAAMGLDALIKALWS